MPYHKAEGITVAVSGAKVRQLREQAGLSLNELGKKIGLSKAAMSAMEVRGTALDRVSRLTALAAALGLNSLDPLFEAAGRQEGVVAEEPLGKPVSGSSPIPGVLTALQAAAIESLTMACKHGVVSEDRLIEILVEMHELRNASR